MPKITMATRGRNSTTEYENLDKIKQRIQSLRDQVEEEQIPSLEEIKADLARIATDEDKPDGVRLKAYDQLTRMNGGYRDKLEVSGQMGVQETEDALSGLLDG